MGSLGGGVRGASDCYLQIYNGKGVVSESGHCTYHRLTGSGSPLERKGYYSRGIEGGGGRGQLAVATELGIKASTH